MTKQELLRQIREKHEDLLQHLRRVPAGRMDSHPGPTAKWTVKNLVAHLTYWQHETLDRVRGRSQSASWGDVDATNAGLLQQSAARSVEEVLKSFADSCSQVTREVEALPEDQLQAESPWNDGLTLWEHIADDTSIHFEEHLPSLRTWLSSL